MSVSIYDDLTDILIHYGNIVQYDQIAGPLQFSLFFYYIK